MSALELHHLHLAQSERIVWLLEEMQVPYKLVLHDRDPKTGLAPKELKEANPAGTAPFLRDTLGGQNIELVETGAIVQYILDRYGPTAKGTRMIRTLEDKDYQSYISWLHYANGSLQPAFSRMLTILGGGIIDSPIGKRYSTRLLGQLQMIDDHLTNNKWLAGDEVSAADAMTVFSLTTMRGFVPIELGAYKNILRYLEDVAARPAYIEAMRKGDEGMKPMIEPVERRFTQFESFRHAIENAKF